MALTRGVEAAAANLGAAVTEELACLAMGSAVVTAEVGERPQPHEGRSGRRRDPPRGQPRHASRSVTRAASGGELSRVMLAIEVATRGDGENRPPTFVFDEVDAGVGGRAALAVGGRLAELAQVAQVVVVTHLPQVAAHADRHLVVSKSTDGRSPRAGCSRSPAPSARPSSRG